MSVNGHVLCSLRLFVSITAFGALFLNPAAARSDSGRQVWLYLENPGQEKTLVKKIREELEWEKIQLKVVKGAIPPDNMVSNPDGAVFALVWFSEKRLIVHNSSMNTHVEKQFTEDMYSPSVISTYVRRLVLMSGRAGPDGEGQKLPEIQDSAPTASAGSTYDVNLNVGMEVSGLEDVDVGGRATIGFGHESGIIVHLHLGFISRLGGDLELFQAPVRAGTGYELRLGIHSFEFLAGFGILSLVAQASTPPSRIDRRAVALVWGEIGWVVALDEDRSWLLRMSVGVNWLPESQRYVFNGETLGKVETIAPCWAVQIGYNLV